MPYKLRHAKGGGYDVIKLATGETVAHSATRHGAIGYIYHAKKADPKPERKAKKK